MDSGKNKLRLQPTLFVVSEYNVQISFRMFFFILSVDFAKIALFYTVNGNKPLIYSFIHVCHASDQCVL